MSETAVRRAMAVLALIGVAVACVGFVYHCRYFWSFTVDDGAISFTFARNLADGYGLVYFPDGERVEGYSNPAWTLLLALLIELGASPFVSSKIAGTIFGAGAIVVLSLAVPRCFGGTLGPASVIVAGLLAANTSFVCYAVSGLENGLYLFMSALVLSLHLRDMRERTAIPWSMPALFILTLVRPEAILTVAIVALHRAAAWLVQRRAPDRQDWIALLLFLVPFGAYHVWHYLYFRSVLPTPYYAKMGAAALPDVWNLGSKGWLYVERFLVSYRYVWLLPLFAAAVVLPGPASGLILVVAFALAGAFFPLYARGDWMAEFRLLTMFTGFSFLLAAGGAQKLFETALAFRRLPRTAQPGAARPAPSWSRLGIGAALLAGAFALALPTANAAKTNSPMFKRRPTVTYEDIAPRAQRFRRAAKTAHVWPEATLADPDMGAVGWDYGGRILDLGRLCDVAFSRYHYHPRFVPERVLDEEQVTFAHVRRWVKNRTRLPMHPRWDQEYVVLPKPGRTVEQHGDYVRKRGVFILDQPPATEAVAAPVGEYGLTLVEFEPLTPVIKPGSILTARHVWTTRSPMPKGVRFNLMLVDPSSGRLVWSTGGRWPVYGWYTSEMWLPGEYVLEWLDTRIQRIAEGRYRYAVQVSDANGVSETIELPGELIVGRAEAAAFISDRLDDTSRLSESDPESAWESYQAALRAGAPRDEQLETRLSGARIKSFIEASKRASTDDESERLAIRARKIDPANSAIRRYVRALSTPIHRRGLESERSRDWNGAFEHFKHALRVDPQLAVARMDAERVRKLRWPPRRERPPARRRRSASPGRRLRSVGRETRTSRSVARGRV